MTRAAIYARYSSDLQSSASIDDQVHQCRKRADVEGWKIIEVYSDQAISGASTLRAGYQQMMMDARAGKYDILIAEAMDRLSRDQEDIAGLYKQLTFAGVKLITLSEGEINELHVGLKGTMNALFLKDLAHKTRRGLEGRIRQGKSGGGNSYGYTVVRKMAADGTPIRGEREINNKETRIIIRIFEEFASGRSPRAIAHDLNAEGIEGPRGNSWGPSTIHGNWRRGTGILNNELYVGKLVWNRQRFIKDPNTGKRQARPNPEEQWVIEEVPLLRIVEQNLWDRVKERQSSTHRRVCTKTNGVRSERARRPRYLLSGLLKCGSCGGGFSKISQHHYGCSTARNKGTCDNLLTIRRDTIEESVLGGLKDQLMHPDAYKEFVAEFNREFNRLAATEDQTRDSLRTELSRTERDMVRIIDAIKAGVTGDTVKDEVAKLEAIKTKLTEQLNKVPAPKPRLHPNLADIYRDKVVNIIETLNNENTMPEATEAIRSLIEAVRLVPDNGTLRIELYGELAALLALGSDKPKTHKNKHLRGDTSEVQVTLVAGVGFEPTTFRL
ncbi:MAG: recombinase family protein [Rhodospirillales bacterium]|nr:recombinase family protein [Rhodospirillales bacterium]